MRAGISIKNADASSDILAIGCCLSAAAASSTNTDTHTDGGSDALAAGIGGGIALAELLNHVVAGLDRQLRLALERVARAHCQLVCLCVRSERD